MRLRGRTDISIGSISHELSIPGSVIEEDFLRFGLGLAGQHAYNINNLTIEVKIF